MKSLELYWVLKLVFWSDPHSGASQQTSWEETTSISPSAHSSYWSQLVYQITSHSRLCKPLCTSKAAGVAGLTLKTSRFIQRLLKEITYFMRPTWSIFFWPSVFSLSILWLCGGRLDIRLLGALHGASWAIFLTYQVLLWSNVRDRVRWVGVIYISPAAP